MLDEHILVHAWEHPGTGEAAKVGVGIIHGFTGNPLATRPMGEFLAERGWTVKVPRLPGHGTTAKDMATTRYEDWRGEVMRVARDLRDTCDTVVLVGHSMGGTLALDIASSLPTLVDGVVTINAQILEPRQLLAKAAPVLQWVVPMVPRDLAGLPSDDINRDDVSENAYSMVPARAAQSLMRNLPRIRMQLVRLEQPILIAVSAVDNTVPPDNSDAIADLVASADVERLTLEKSFHVATLDHDQDLLQDAVAAFVDQVAQRPVSDA